MKAESPFDCLKPEAIAALAEDITYAKATKPAYKVIPLAITAGAFIAIAFVFYITVTTGSSGMAWAPGRRRMRKRRPAACTTSRASGRCLFCT